MGCGVSEEAAPTKEKSPRSDNHTDRSVENGSPVLVQRLRSFEPVQEEPVDTGEPNILLDDEQIQGLYINLTGKVRDSRFKVCRPKAFPGVVGCGAFNWGTGLYVDGVFLLRDYYANHWEASKHVLPEKATYQDESTRGEVCLAWVRQVLLGFNVVLDESEEEISERLPDFGAEYHLPQVSKTEEGHVEVLLWARIQMEGDEEPENTYRKALYVFTPNGACAKPTIMDTKVFWGNARPSWAGVAARAST